MNYLLSDLALSNVALENQWIYASLRNQLSSAPQLSADWAFRLQKSQLVSKPSFKIAFDFSAEIVSWSDYLTYAQEAGVIAIHYTVFLLDEFQICCLKIKLKKQPVCSVDILYPRD